MEQEPGRPEPQVKVPPGPINRVYAEDPRIPDTTKPELEKPKSGNVFLYLTILGVVAMTFLTVVSFATSPNSTAAIGLMGVANTIVSGMAGMAFGQRIGQ